MTVGKSDMGRIGSINVVGSKSTLAGVIAAVIIVPALAWQTHRVGTSGPEPPALQGAGRWHYLAPLLHARGEVAVAEAKWQSLRARRLCRRVR
jgi:hypothetical protein